MLPIAPSLISSRQKMRRRGSGAGGYAISGQSAFSSGISQSRIRETARPALSGWCLREYCARMKSKPSVATSVVASSTRVLAFSPGNASDVQSRHSPLCGILSDSG